MIKPKIGIRKLHYALLTKDETGTKTTYSTPVPIAGLISMKTKNNNTELTRRADMNIYRSKSKISDSDIEIELASIDNKLKADITAEAYDTATGFTSLNSMAGNPVFALLWEEVRETDEGTASTYKVLYKCTLSEEENEGQGDNENQDVTNIKLVGKAIPLLYNNNIMASIETDDAAAGKTELLNKWFKEVIVEPSTTPAA